MFRGPGAHGKQPPRRPPAPGHPLPARPPRRSLRTAPLRIPPPARPAAPRPPPPPGQDCSPQRKTPRSSGVDKPEPGAHSPPPTASPLSLSPSPKGAAYPRVSRGPEVITGRCSLADPRARPVPDRPPAPLPSAPEPCSPGGHRPCPAAGQAEPGRAGPEQRRRHTR